MAAVAGDDLERRLGLGVLNGFMAPLNTLQFELVTAEGQDGMLTAVKKFMETHLSEKNQVVVVNLQDERIQELFDEAVRKMALGVINELQKSQKRAEQIIDFRKHVEAFHKFAMRAASEAPKPATWTERAQHGLQQVGSTVRKMLPGAPSATAEEEPFEMVDKPPLEDYVDRAIQASTDPKVVAIVAKWKKNPSLLLEIEPTKELLRFLRNDLLPLAKIPTSPTPAQKKEA